MADPIGTNTAYQSAIECILGVKGQTLSVGADAVVEVPWNCSVFRWTMVADQSGSSVVDVLLTPYESFDDVTHPVSPGDSIAGGSPPTISGDVKARDTALLNWSRSLTAGRILRFILNSVAAQQQITVSLEVFR